MEAICIVAIVAGALAGVKLGHTGPPGAGWNETGAAGQPQL